MRSTIWYVWSVNDDPVTNQYLVQVVGEQNPEYLHTDKLCADGKRRNLFRCPKGYADVLKAITAIAEYGLKIEVFQENIDGVITRYDLWKSLVRKAARYGRFTKARTRNV